MQPCELYFSEKTPEQRMFAAAAALYWLTGKNSYRKDADSWYKKTDAGLFYMNWCAD